jgi:hypothetical protein
MAADLAATTFSGSIEPCLDLINPHPRHFQSTRYVHWAITSFQPVQNAIT